MYLNTTLNFVCERIYASAPHEKRRKGTSFFADTQVIFAFFANYCVFAKFSLQNEGLCITDDHPRVRTNRVIGRRVQGLLRR